MMTSPHARFHHVSLGYKIGFDNDKVEINAVKREAAAPAPVPAAATGTSQSTDAALDANIDWSKASQSGGHPLLSWSDLHGVGADR